MSLSSAIMEGCTSPQFNHFHFKYPLGSTVSPVVDSEGAGHLGKGISVHAPSPSSEKMNYLTQILPLVSPLKKKNRIKPSSASQLLNIPPNLNLGSVHDLFHLTVIYLVTKKI